MAYLHWKESLNISACHNLTVPETCQKICFFLKMTDWVDNLIPSTDARWWSRVRWCLEQKVPQHISGRCGCCFTGHSDLNRSLSHKIVFRGVYCSHGTQESFELRWKLLNSTLEWMSEVAVWWKFGYDIVPYQTFEVVAVCQRIIQEIARIVTLVQLSYISCQHMRHYLPSSYRSIALTSIYLSRKFFVGGGFYFLQVWN